jgi:N6-adenosine-specific RNA methylase IME4
MSLFDVILADPPWTFRTWSDKGAGRSPEYPTLNLDELKALPVGSLAAPDCALFLWATWPVLFRDVPELVKAWGFEYRTLAFLWVKANKTGAGFFQGLGYYTRANTGPACWRSGARCP